MDIGRYLQEKRESFLRPCIRPFTRYGERVGLAFQIAEDILDVEGKKERLGKNVGGDLRKKKATHLGLFGVEESKRRARELIESGLEALNSLGVEADPL
jgi:geranylgeranyl diphosphate synthase type II